MKNKLASNTPVMIKDENGGFIICSVSELSRR